MNKNSRSRLLVFLLAAVLFVAAAVPAYAAMTGKSIDVYTGVRIFVNGRELHPADVKGKIEDSLNKLREAHKAQDLAGIDAATAELDQLFQQMYQQAGGAQGGPQAGGFAGDAGFNAGNQGAQGNGGNNHNDAQDVPYEEVK